MLPFSFFPDFLVPAVALAALAGVIVSVVCVIRGRRNLLPVLICSALVLVPTSCGVALRVEAHFRFAKVSQFVRQSVEQLRRGGTPKISPDATHDDIQKMEQFRLAVPSGSPEVEMVEYFFGLYDLRLRFPDGSMCHCDVDDARGFMRPFSPTEFSLLKLEPPEQSKQGPATTSSMNT